MVRGDLRSRSELCREPLRRFLPDFGPTLELFLALTDPPPDPQPDADQTAPPDEALKLQQPLLDGTLRIVAGVVKKDAAEPAT